MLSHKHSEVGVDISTILKIVGILVAGALGVLGTITETRDKNSNALTYWGRCALGLTIAGALLALGAQIFDSISQSNRDHVILTGLKSQSENTNHILKQDSDILSQIHEQSTTTNDILKQDNSILKNTQEQSTIATTSLHSIQDVLSQFNEVQIDAEFELPQTDPRVAAIALEFHRWANSDVPTAANCQGFNLRNRNATIICIPFEANQQTVKTMLPSVGLLSDVWQALPIMTGRVWINRRHKPLAMLLDGKGTASDLFMFNSDFGSDNRGGLVYYESTGKIYIKPSRFYSDSKNRACWFADDAILGIHTLAGAQIVVEFNWRKSPSASDPDPLLFKIRPDFLNLSAGQTSIFLKKLTTTVQRPMGPYGVNFVVSEFSQAVVPNERDILGRREAVPPARMTGSVIVR
jgi:hypothetical protein